MSDKKYDDFEIEIPENMNEVDYTEQLINNLIKKSKKSYADELYRYRVISFKYYKSAMKLELKIDCDTENDDADTIITESNKFRYKIEDITGSYILEISILRS
jgi:hypothetical protein